MSTNNRENTGLTAANQYALAQQYETGDGVRLDVERAVYWYRKSAAHIDTDASTRSCNSFENGQAALCALGRLYEKGHGLPKDYKLAHACYLRATEHIYPSEQAQCSLGRFYRKGLGVKKDLEQARVWLYKVLKGTVHYHEAAAELRKLEKSALLQSEKFSRKPCVVTEMSAARRFSSSFSLRRFSAHLHAESAVANLKLADIGRLSLLAIRVDGWQQCSDGQQVSELQLMLLTTLKPRFTRLLALDDGRFLAICIDTDHHRAAWRAREAQELWQATLKKRLAEGKLASSSPWLAGGAVAGLCVGIATTDLSTTNTAERLLQKALDRLDQTSVLGADHIYPLDRPLDEYLAEIATLPMPTAQQIEQFCRLVMADHSWYKGFIMRGMYFSFFLNPELGPEGKSQSPLNRKNMLLSAEYVQRFGYLDYRFGMDVHREDENIPTTVQKHGTVRCYPYLSNQSNAHNLIWHRNQDVVEQIEGLDKGDDNATDISSHPDLDLIKLLLAKRATWQAALDEATAGWPQEKWHAAKMLLYYEKQGLPPDANAAEKVAEYHALLNEEELRRLRPEINRVDTAKAAERQAYDILNDSEASKIKATIEQMLVWLMQKKNQGRF